MAVTGNITLTVFINADGTVADVISSIETENAREFADRVAARFKGARFSPGEINRKAVKSKLHITVVGEELDTPGKR